MCAVLTALLQGAAPANAERANSPCDGSPQDETIIVPVSSQGVTYPVLVHVPPAYNGHKPMPLVFNLHGSTQTGAMQQEITGTDQTADRHGFVVAYPDGGIPAAAVGPLPLPPPFPRGFFWNVPGVPVIFDVPTPVGARDDVVFIADTIDAIAATVCIDLRRVDAIGYSGGGRMASALACHLDSRIAAIGTVAGLRSGTAVHNDASRPDPATCAPEHEVAVVAVHGQRDEVNPYVGGTSSGWNYSVRAALQRWAQIDGCRPEPRRQAVTDTVTLVRYKGCRASSDVWMYLSSSGGHTWPGRPESGVEGGGVLGPVDMSIDASELIWAFLSKHSLPGTIPQA